MDFDLIEIVKGAGYIGLFIIVFAETGLLFGFFLPGDSLLLTAVVLATDKFPDSQLSLAILIPLLIVAAILGDATGYLIGRRAGPRLFVRDDARFFRRKHLIRASEFYAKHGGKTNRDCPIPRHHPHLCPDGGRCGTDAVLEVHRLQCRRRRRLGGGDGAARLLGRRGHPEPGRVFLPHHWRGDCDLIGARWVAPLARAGGRVQGAAFSTGVNDEAQG